MADPSFFPDWREGSSLRILNVADGARVQCASPEPLKTLDHPMAATRLNDECGEGLMSRFPGATGLRLHQMSRRTEVVPGHWPIRALRRRRADRLGAGRTRHCIETCPCGGRSSGDRRLVSCAAGTPQGRNQIACRLANRRSQGLETCHVVDVVAGRAEDVLRKAECGSQLPR